jgi:hypothetical protein
VEEGVRELSADVEKHGWVVMRISADGPGPDFAYTIGLLDHFGHPEVIVVGLPLGVAHRILNTLGIAVRGGKRYVAGAVYDDLLEGYDVTFRAVPAYQLGAYLGWGRRYYRESGREDFPALQLIYPDRQRRWPWQDGVADGFRNAQPVLADEPEPPWARDAAG